MDEIKRCQACGIVISSIHDIGFNRYRHIRIKYCNNCRDVINTYRNRGYQSDFKQRKKTLEELKSERVGLLQEEIELIRKRNSELREEIDFLKYQASR